MIVYEYIFWINDLNIHLSPLISAVSEMKSVLVIANKRFNEDREKDGWQIPTFGKSKVVISPTKEEIVAFVKENMNSIHIFLGINAFKTVHDGFLIAVKNNVRIGIISESGIKLGLKGQLRRVKSFLNFVKYSKHINFILAMGYIGEKWFIDSFFSKNKIFPFLYVTQKPIITKAGIDKIDDTNVVITIVAQCIKRKNLQFVIKSLSKLKNSNWQLNIIGEGKLKSKLIALTNKLELNNRVQFLGTKQNSEIQHFFSISDFSILPSLWDGWGAVVNESLQSGVPVVCSDQCGASCLLENEKRGNVFQLKSKKQLIEIIDKRIRTGKLTQENRQNIVSWSENISADSVANYFQNIIDHTFNHKGEPKPLPPWKNNN